MPTWVLRVLNSCDWQDWKFSFPRPKFCLKSLFPFISSATWVFFGTKARIVTAGVKPWKEDSLHVSSSVEQKERGFISSPPSLPTVHFLETLETLVILEKKSWKQSQRCLLKLSLQFLSEPSIGQSRLLSNFNFYSCRVLKLIAVPWHWIVELRRNEKMEQTSQDILSKTL